MTPFHVTYSDIMVKQRIEAWAEGLDFDPEEQIFMLLEDKFGAKVVSVIDSQPEGDAMMLIVGTDVWIEPREFALLKNGSLAW
jgi:hypothetical protein